VISEIPGLSHAAPERHPQGTLSPQGPLDARGIFCFLVINMSQFSELTPVRRQTTGAWLPTLSASDSHDGTSCFLSLLLFVFFCFVFRFVRALSPSTCPPLPQCDKDVPPQRRYVAYFLLCLFHLPFHSTTWGGAQDRPHPQALLCVTQVTHASATLHTTHVGTARHMTRAGVVLCTT